MWVVVTAMEWTMKSCTVEGAQRKKRGDERREEKAPDRGCSRGTARVRFLRRWMMDDIPVAGLVAAAADAAADY